SLSLGNIDFDVDGALYAQRFCLALIFVDREIARERRARGEPAQSQPTQIPKMHVGIGHALHGLESRSGKLSLTRAGRDERCKAQPRDVYPCVTRAAHVPDRRRLRGGLACPAYLGEAP